MILVKFGVDGKVKKYTTIKGKYTTIDLLHPQL